MVAQLRLELSGRSSCNNKMAVLFQSKRPIFVEVTSQWRVSEGSQEKNPATLIELSGLSTRLGPMWRSPVTPMTACEVLRTCCVTYEVARMT